MSRGYAIWTIGCQMNEADALRAAAQLEALGFRPAPEEEADLALVTSCVVRQAAEDKVLGRLRRLEAEKRRRPGLCVALMGCLVGMDPPEALRARFPFVDVFLPPSDLAPLAEWLRRDGPPPPGGPGCADAGALPPSRAAEVRAHVPAVLGCSRACSYCVIPSRRGPERSRPPDEILREARGLAAGGVREIILLGQIIDRYGRDLDPPAGLPGLLRAVAALEGVERVRFLTNHPKYFHDELLDAVAEQPAICPHFVLPVQAGHDEILARMRRGYGVGDFERRVGRIRARLPGAALHTDLIVGFPGETAAHFEATVRLVERMRFDKIHIARYSPRPGTFAARAYPDDVPEAEKEERRLRLDRIQAGIQGEKNAAFLGRRVRVLVEGPEPRRPGRWRGRTPCDRLVFVDAPGDLRGRVLEPRITWTGPFTLVGESGPGARGEPGEGRGR